MSTQTETTIQLPPDDVANKNLLRAIEVDLATGSTLEQVIILGDQFGNLVLTDAGALRVSAPAIESLLEQVVQRLDTLAALMERKQ